MVGKSAPKYLISAMVGSVNVKGIVNNNFVTGGIFQHLIDFSALIAVSDSYMKI